MSTMTQDLPTMLAELDSAGLALVPGAFSEDECRDLARELDAALAACADGAGALRRQNGAIYGARNLLAVFPAAAEIWRRPALVALQTAALGERFGLVRGLFFDKPPEGNWSLPWHQDLSIAVREHLPALGPFRNPTTKAGAAHVEAPDELLKQMLTLRIHLDDVTEENGPLVVLPGTHLGRDAPAMKPPVTILAAAGDVLAIRPLVSHASLSSQPGTARHRRIIHLEFAASEKLPAGYQWRDFVTARRSEPVSKQRFIGSNR